MKLKTDGENDFSYATFAFGIFVVHAQKYTKEEAVLLFLQLRPELEHRKEQIKSISTFCRAAYSRDTEGNCQLHYCLANKKGPLKFPVWVILPGE